MKKSLAILLAFVFLLSSLGFSINKHYCGNRLKSVNLILIQNNKSCCGDVEMPEGCCKNKTKYIKLKEDYMQASSVSIPSSDFFFVAVFTQIITQLLTNPQNEYLGDISHDPPIISTVSLSILYRSILI